MVLQIEEKRGIWREGPDLFSKVSIGYTEAILGTVLKVQTVEGLRELSIPSGTQPGDRVKLPHMGVPKVNKFSGRGDHVFIVDVRIPKHVSHRERELIEELASLRSSSEGHSLSVDDDGDKNYTRRQNARHPGDKGKPGIFSWNPLKRFFSEKRITKRFCICNNGNATSIVEVQQITSFIFIIFMVCSVYRYIYLCCSNWNSSS